MDPFDFGRLWTPFRANTRRFQEVFAHHRNYAGLLHQTETLAYLIRSYRIKTRC